VAAPAATVNLERSATPDPRLFTGLSHETGALRQHAAWALGEFESPGAVEALLERIADADPGVRGAVAWALGEIKDPTAVGPLSIMLREDEDPFVREMAALALGEIGAPSAAASLVRALANDELRPAALWALQEIGVDSAGTASRHFGGSESADTRWLDRPEMLLQLTQTIRDAPGHMPDGSLPRIGHLLDVARRRDPAGLGDALEALATDDPLVRSHGALAAGRIGDMSAVPPLLAALRDPAISVRSMAVWALDEINVSAHGR
jgi:HEAT repeat protein